MILAQDINIKEEKIEAVKAWTEPKSIRDIEVFLGLANFYQWFIQSLSKIVALLILMLKRISTLANVNIHMKLLAILFF